jgi:hypothetical protein
MGQLLHAAYRAHAGWTGQAGLQPTTFAASTAATTFAASTFALRKAGRLPLQRESTWLNSLPVTTHPPAGPFGTMPCNAFAFCAEPNCFEPDAHKHSQGDCWLKFTEAPASPEVNMRGRLSKAMQQRHPQAPAAVAWHAGVLLPRGVQLRNGSWSPRHNW